MEGVTMSFGKMNTFIDLVKKEVSVDAEGFKSEKEVTLASVRAYREGRHGSERWANMAAFSEATDLFRFRIIPGVSVTTDMAILCDGDRFDITSVEDVDQIFTLCDEKAHRYRCIYCEQEYKK